MALTANQEPGRFVDQELRSYPVVADTPATGQDGMSDWQAARSCGSGDDLDILDNFILKHYLCPSGSDSCLSGTHIALSSAGALCAARIRPASPAATPD